MMALFTAHDFKTAFLTVLSNFLTTYLPAQGEIETWEAKGWWYMLDSLEIGPDSELGNRMSNKKSTLLHSRFWSNANYPECI